jgi:ElaB/YqjD/DUF883 family membrane-anchored ribosome-binding protein
MTKAKEEDIAMASETDVAKERLIKDFKAVIRDAEDLLNATASQTGEKVTAVRSRAEESIKNARAKLDELQDDMMARGRAYAKEADDIVRQNPWQAIAISAGVAFLLGMLSGRR